MKHGPGVKISVSSGVFGVGAHREIVEPQGLVRQHHALRESSGAAGVVEAGKICIAAASVFARFVVSDQRLEAEWEIVW